MNNRTITLTDAQGNLIIPADEAYEPEPGSIVLTEGVPGTCWQRYFSDGLWHSTTGRTKGWADMLTQRNLSILYDAEARPARARACAMSETMQALVGMSPWLVLFCLGKIEQRRRRRARASTEGVSRNPKWEQDYPWAVTDVDEEDDL